MLRHLVLFLFCLTFCLIGDSSVVRAERRVALLIGNASYHEAALKNPRNDVAAMKAMLTAAGFDAVIAGIDLDRIGMLRALRSFEDLAGDADIGIVYYSGHGIEYKGENYLIPIDAQIDSERDIEDQAVNLERVLGSLDGARRLKLVLLDACRSSPFADRVQRVATRGNAVKGLARVEAAAANTLIAYAAAPGHVALDGDGSDSPYTVALVRHLTTPGLDVELALRRVRDDVVAATGNRQVPFETGSLGGGEIMLGRPVQGEPVSRPTTGRPQTDGPDVASLGTSPTSDGVALGRPVQDDQTPSKLTGSAQVKKPRSIGISLGSLGNPFFIALSKGVQAEARAINPKVKILTFGYDYDLGRQVQQINDFVVAGVDIILLNPGDPRALKPAIENAQRAGIKVVALDTYTDGADAAVTTDNVQAGRIACQYFVDKLGGLGNVIIENGPQVSSVIDRVQGCKQALGKAPNMRLLSADQDGKGQRSAGLTVMKSLLTRFPDVAAIFAINDPQALGSDLAARQLNRKDIIITSIDGAPDIEAALKYPGSPMIQASASQDPYDLARKGVDIAVDLLNGRPPANRITRLASKLVTRENVGTYKGWQAER